MTPADTSTTTDQLLSVDETCERLRIGRAMVYELIRSNRLGSVKIGRRRLVPNSAVQDFIRRISAEAQQ